MAVSYKAFITYSHSDSKVAAWLQRKLESYSVPKRLVGQASRRGAIPPRLRPIFRDREELSAGSNLAESISTSLRYSEFLICICSPAARKSRWVNLEIEEFRREHGDDRIICVVVDGDPYATRRGDPDRECFPPALGLDGTGADGSVPSTVEHVAADLRPGIDGYKGALLKIVAGLIGIGLDELVQRDAQRRAVRMLGFSLVSGAGMIAMAILAFIAVEARNAEELRRADAENLIEFMLTDLRDRLEPVGRLDALDAVGQEAIDYYSRQDLADHSVDALGRRARAFHLLGEVDDLRGDLQRARDAFDEAYQTTGELVRRFPDDGQRVFDHAQSVFWVGYLDWQLGELERTQAAFLEYLELSKRLGTIDPERIDWLAEQGHANINMGVYAMDTGANIDAIGYFESARDIFERTGKRDPDNSEWAMLLGQAHAWLANAFENSGEPAKAISHRESEANIYTRLLSADASNNTVKQRLIASHQARANLALNQGRVSGAVEQLRTATTYGADLVALEPDNTLTTYMAALAFTTLAHALHYDGKTVEARQQLDHAGSILADLLKRNNDVLEWQALHAEVLLARASRYAGPGDRRERLLRVQQELDALFDANPDSRLVQLLRVRALHYLAKSSRASGDDDEAETLSRRIVAELDPIAGQLSPEYLSILAEAHRRLGDAGEAASLRSQIVAADYRHPEFGITSSNR